MPTLAIPGFVDAHSHGFQRALRGRAPGGDFWAWREEMLAVAASLTVEQIRLEYVEVYRELRANGYTAAGEFHYLGLDEARAAAAAAEEAGVAFVCLYACYLRGGIPRFRQASVADYLRDLEALRAGGVAVGVAPHSVRACPPEALRELGRYAADHGLPLHVHANEQPREIDECIAETACGPSSCSRAKDASARARPSSTRRTRTAVSSTSSATRARGSACARRRRRTSATASCPSRASATAGSACASAPTRTSGSTRSRSCASWKGSAAGRPARAASSRSTSLLAVGADEGAAALGLDAWPDAHVDLDHLQLRGVAEPDVYEALVFGCSADVLRSTSDQ